MPGIGTRLDRLEAGIRTPAAFHRTKEPPPLGYYEEVVAQLDAYVLATARPRLDTPREHIRRVVEAALRYSPGVYTRCGNTPPTEPELRGMVDREASRICDATPEQWQAAKELTWGPG